jgi:DNA replication protein DnaC
LTVEDFQPIGNTFDAILSRLGGQPELTAEQREEQSREEAAKARRERNCKLWDTWNALTNPRYRDCTLENYMIDDETPHAAAQRTVLAEIRRYAGDIDNRVSAGQGLLLFGPSGTGKDHLLTGLARVAVAKELSIKWINGSTLYRTMRDGMGEDEEKLVNRYVYPKILYLSDPIPPVGSLTPFQASTLFGIIDGRYQDKKATWATMNVGDGQEASQRLGSPIADRLRDGAVSLHCSWPSYRKGAT